jgi:hypothetical protein
MSEFQRSLALSGVLLTLGLGGTAVGGGQRVDSLNAEIRGCSTTYVGPEAAQAEETLCKDNLSEAQDAGLIAGGLGLGGLVGGLYFAYRAAKSNRKPRAY